MKDGDLRGIVLEKFYEVRNQQPNMVNPLSFPGLNSIEPDQHRLLNICEQLGDYGLIRWKSLGGLTAVGGMGKISASGVDVVEGTARSPITVTFHDHSVSVSQSSNVQIGDSNTQDVKVRIDIQPHDLARLVTDLTKHLDELNLNGRQKARAEAQISTLKAELAGDPDPAIVRQAGRTLRNITEGAISSLLATAAQPSVWYWIHQTLASFGVGQA